jgi:hypothetical protein
MGGNRFLAMATGWQTIAVIFWQTVEAEVFKWKQWSKQSGSKQWGANNQNGSNGQKWDRQSAAAIGGWQAAIGGLLIR